MAAEMKLTQKKLEAKFKEDLKLASQSNQKEVQILEDQVKNLNKVLA
jgi:hypothetical protein